MLKTKEQEQQEQLIINLNRQIQLREKLVNNLIEQYEGKENLIHLHDFSQGMNEGAKIVLENELMFINQLKDALQGNEPF
ncbi:hypothetical protein [Bacillus cereus]|uniref:hypothetical protein n=1 Tax=Bacillus cereus TaxID=1396 RepID=UPI000BF384C5|nr:hypothetical protein [Bacillus cereus]PFF91250.1 hypothetical protein CN329_12655 [Bacillus cereus]